MSDFFESVSEWFKDRKSSPIYAIFLVAFLTWNWQFFYILFFEDEAYLRGLTAVEYANKFSHAISNLNTQINVWGVPIVDNLIVLFAVNFFLLFAVPFLAVYFIIWWFPRVYDMAYERYLKSHFAKRMILDRLKAEYQKQRTEALRDYREETREQTKVLEEIVAATEKRKEVEKNVPDNVDLETIQWNEDYIRFKESPLFYNFREIYDLVYEYEGQAKNKYNDRNNVSPKMIAYGDTNGLLLFDGVTNRYQLTEKGKFFVKKYLEEQ